MLCFGYICCIATQSIVCNYIVFTRLRVWHTSSTTFLATSNPTKEKFESWPPHLSPHPLTQSIIDWMRRQGDLISQTSRVASHPWGTHLLIRSPIYTWEVSTHGSRICGLRRRGRCFMAPHISLVRTRAWKKNWSSSTNHLFHVEHHRSV
jgi:hypothetical protein